MINEIRHNPCQFLGTGRYRILVNRNLQRGLCLYRIAYLGNKIHTGSINPGAADDDKTSGQCCDHTLAGIFGSAINRTGICLFKFIVGMTVLVLSENIICGKLNQLAFDPITCHSKIAGTDGIHTISCVRIRLTGIQVGAVDDHIRTADFHIGIDIFPVGNVNFRCISHHDFILQAVELFEQCRADTSAGTNNPDFFHVVSSNRFSYISVQKKTGCEQQPVPQVRFYYSISDKECQFFNG